MEVKEFIQKASDLYNNKYCYSDIYTITDEDSISVVCPIHGDFHVPVQDHLDGKECSMCNKIDSKKEKYFQFVNILMNIGKKFSNSLSIILNKYKNTDIETVLYDLEDFNESFVSKDGLIEKDDRPSLKRHFVTIRDLTIDVFLLKTIEKFDSYNFENEREEFQIIINRNVNESNIMDNQVATFKTAEARDREFKLLKNKLREFNIFFL